MKIIKVLIALLSVLSVIFGSFFIWLSYNGYAAGEVKAVSRDLIYSEGGRLTCLRNGKYSYKHLLTQNNKELESSYVPFIVEKSKLYYWSSVDNSLAIKDGDKTDWFGVTKQILSNGDDVDRISLAEDKLYLDVRMEGVIELDLISHKARRLQNVLSLRTYSDGDVQSLAYIDSEHNIRVKDSKSDKIFCRVDDIRDWDFNFKDRKVYLVGAERRLFVVSEDGRRRRLKTPFLKDARGIYWQKDANEMWVPLGVTFSSGNGIAAYLPGDKLRWITMDIAYPVTRNVHQLTSEDEGIENLLN